MFKLLIFLKKMSIICVKMNSEAISPEIAKKAEEACAKLIPNKSGERYQKQFSHFCEWKAENNVKTITFE